MKHSTPIAAQFMSVGKPDSTTIAEGSMREVMLTLAGWMADVTMGSHVRVTIARTREELVKFTQVNRSGGADLTMLDELAAMLVDDSEDEVEQA